MPASRDRLHLSKVTEFAVWAESRGYKREHLVGIYEVLRLRAPSGGLLIFFERDGCDHATVPYGDADKLVNRWLRERRGR